MASRRFLALDIGASTLKLAEFAMSGNGPPTLVNFGQQSLGMDPSSEENRNSQIVSVLKNLLASRPYKSRRVAISVSGQVVLTRFMKLPAADESKIRQMVRYEAAQNVPFPIEEVVWDYQVVGGKAETDLEVVLVAIKSEIIEGFNRCAEEAGLEVEVVDVAPLCIYNALLYNYEIGEDCTLLLDIGARTTNLIFVETNKVFIRSIPIAGNTITQSVAQEFEISFAEAEDLKLRQGFVGLGGAYEEPEFESSAKLSKIIRNVMTRLHAEVARSINFYKSQQNGRAPKRLLLSGGTSVISYADHFFKEKMEVEVSYFNPFRSVPIQVNSEELEKVAHSMCEVVGLGLRLVTECPIEINLVPPTVMKRRAFVRKIPFFVASMVGIILVILSWWLYYWKVTQLLSRHQSVVSAELDRLMQVESRLKGTEKKAAIARAEAEQIQQVGRFRYLWIEIFQDLQDRIPADLWITQLIPRNNQRVLSHTGTAPAATSAPIGRGGGRLRNAPQLPPDFMPPGMETPPPYGAEGRAKGENMSVQKGITEFEIRGLCLNNPSSPRPYKPIDDFKAGLDQSKYFRDVQIVEQGDVDAKDWTFGFRIHVKLKTPIPY